MDLLLLSGGLDSVTLAHMIRPAAALWIGYGQSEQEAHCAEAAASALGIPLRRLYVRLRRQGRELPTASRARGQAAGVAAFGGHSFPSGGPGPAQLPFWWSWASLRGRRRWSWGARRGPRPPAGGAGELVGVSPWGGPRPGELVEPLPVELEPPPW